jgi:hypothetical protein
MLLFICAINLCCLIMFSTTKLPGNTYTIYMIYGSGLVSGMISSGVFIKYVRDYNAYCSSMLCILSSTLLLYSGFHLSPLQVYLLFFT